MNSIKDIEKGEMAKRTILFFVFSLIVLFQQIDAQNPIIRDQFTADPSARVFNGRVYLFSSHDIPVPPGKNLRKDWFCMEDYHVFSSEDLVDWTDHGVILTQYQVPWVDSTTYSMWAPDCVERNGKYYFYFPAISNERLPDAKYRMFRIGVAISDRPEGPYKPLPEPIKGVFGIDPNVFIDRDGQAYIYWSLGKIFVAKLKENMIELATEPKEIDNLPVKGLKEGPWVFERNGIYYLTFPHVENEIERLEYAMGTHPMGPFKMAGVIMDESPMNCWTNHHSIIEYRGQWYLFYHQNHLSPHFDKNRSVCIDSLFFNPDGTIRKVIPTQRGVGITKANRKIEIDRYSQISETGVAIQFLDTNDTFKGWKAVFYKKGAMLQYNSVDFGQGNYKYINMKIFSPQGTVMELRLDKRENLPIARLVVPPTKEWQTIKAKIEGLKPGIHNLILSSCEDKLIEIDWLSFSQD